MEKASNILAIDDEESFTSFIKLNLQTETRYDVKVTTTNSRRGTGFGYWWRLKLGITLFQLVLFSFTGFMNLLTCRCNNCQGTS
jgi:hypothetical protein